MCEDASVTVNTQGTDSGKRILVVDDERAVRETLRVVLRFEGHTVVEAANGKEACLLYTPGDFDLVITDYNMPEMKGDELARTIKCLVPSQPILMLTAHAAEACGQENPVDAVLEKPFSLGALRQMIAMLPKGEADPAKAPEKPPVKLAKAPEGKIKLKG